MGLTFYGPTTILLVKNIPLSFCCNLTKYWLIFKRRSRKYAIKQSLEITSQVKRVATLPCETQMSNN